MAVSAVLWKLASPYDAYISHVAQLNSAVERIRYFNEVAQGYEAGLNSSLRLGAASTNPAARIERFRLQLGAAASSMSDEQFEDFISHLGGGDVADVDANRAKTASRMGTMQRGLEEYFSIAGHELATLEKRAYNPSRGDIARQLRENRLPATTIEEYRRILHELGTRIGAKA